jgi:hypothetical protein
MTQDSMLYMILKNSPLIPLIKAINLNKINSSKSKLIVEKKIDKMNDINIICIYIFSNIKKILYKYVS